MKKLQKYYKKLLFQNLFILGGLFGLFIFPIQFAHAADVYIDAPTESYGVGDTFLLPIKLDTKGESINTVSVDMVFTDNILSVKSIKTNDSPILHWVDSPTISGNSVSFSGIIPNGFDGAIDPNLNTKHPAILIWLEVVARAGGNATLTFTDVHLYKNDGNGTETIVYSPSLSLKIVDTGTNKKPQIIDTVPPEQFTPRVVSIRELYNGRYTLIFDTIDTGSGVAYYEVSEGDGPWFRAESPYILLDQTLRNTIRVRVFDNSGNSRIEIVDTSVAIPAYVFSLVFIFLIIGGYFIFVRIKKRIRRKQEYN